MRIWSLHPQYLDARGLTALWREALLAKQVLEGKTRGYRHHPQLIRFKQSEDPLVQINHYLAAVYQEAVKRGYRFNKSKFNSKGNAEKMKVTGGQMRYEINHLLKKLKKRNKKKYNALAVIKQIEPHPLFEVIAGEVEDWEKPGIL